jgi:oxygen-independent coproporphyrinogen-3 oxidase
VQSFHDADLRLLNRSHNPGQATESLDNALKAGFDNVNIDLIYGIPGSDLKRWETNLDTAIRIFPAHISAYHLTYEHGSVMEHWKNKKRIYPIGENESFEQFTTMIDMLEGNDYGHYEISNFARDGKTSMHNTAYWTGSKYLGFGPSAHSFNGRDRRWNISRNASYIKALRDGTKYYELETPDHREQYHDYLITRLRTMQGINLDTVDTRWGNQFSAHLIKEAGKYIDSGRIKQKDQVLTLTREGMFISDHILSSLFMPT